MFYPADARELHAVVERLLAAAAVADEPPPKAIIAPHAGYIYSGPVAATVYARLRPLAGRVERVVLLGPSHRVAFRGLATSSADFFHTPLGDVPLDREAIARAEGLPQVTSLDAAHRAEHSLEVHLPFLQSVLGTFRLVPLVVGDADPDSTAEVIDLLWGGEETLIVVSSDLSHYHDYDTARRLDAATTTAIERLDPSAVHYDDACGRNPINGLLRVARRRRLTARTLDLRNSGDTAGPRDSVVGYGAYVFH
jgi:AmmeMemoRadiSam system protein B